MIQAKTYTTSGGNKVIEFGKVAIMLVFKEGSPRVLQVFIDVEDLPKVADRYWRAQASGQTHYAVTGHSALNRMHHFIVGKPPSGHVTDHKSRNGLNNRQLNLYHVTKSANKINRGGKPYAGTRSGCLGVYKHGKKWQVNVRRNGVLMHLGTFDTVEEANEVSKARREEMFI